MSDAVVTIAGNLTDDPELKYTPSGDAVCSFSVAVNERKKNDGGEWETASTTFFRVSAWRKLAEGLAESLAKGDRAVLVGAIRAKEWTDGDGNSRTSLEVTATDGGPSMKFGVRR